MTFKKLFSVTLLALAFSGSSYAVLDDVKPVDDDQAIKLRLIAPERNLPTHATRVPRVTVYANSECRDRLFGLKTDKTKPKEIVEAQKPLKNGTPYCIHYFMPYLDYDNEGHSFTLARGKMDAPLVVKTVQMKRIDVHHVVVTRPDGTKYTVKGKFDLSVLVNESGDKERELGEFETGFGIDVPHGFVYRVNVSAETEDGPMEYSKDLDFTKN